MFEVVQHLGVTMATALAIVNAIKLGFTIAAIISLISGVGGWIAFWYGSIQRKVWELGATAAAFW
ncbi:hypothetical protein [Paenibacillus mucilaginosus]|uniref:Uncharacterized protein n=1 Tax=Paenibacillus mucilaginosus (strain KNP414) TaxID=1036673 RepID=F8FLY9_PAEMK|nr:hypothetical protein [Paenibacillus mucilaginosus]AEI45615.1 hypothetical protein KNP414_07105 [Paenibacillus mucilaginosus KNP414]MCG7215360.1 hypothetical protein [Paenibacillus mucilaginosus]WDM27020.1 hypothetical protein KCX80_32240 [Paenibacillus mucilaginosus]